MTADKFLAVANAEVGYKEKNNNDTKYGIWYGMNNNSWCAMFISWCANQVGVLNKLIPKYSGCGTGYNWFKNKGKITMKPKAGDIGFLKPTIKGATSSHTFIVYKVDGNTITTIEGNLDNQVKKNTRKLTDSNILGFGSVDWETPKEEIVSIYYVDNVDYEGLNVRNSNNKVVDLLSIGTKVEITKISGDKAYLSNGNYVYKAYLSTKKSSTKTVTTGGKVLNVRNKASILGKKIATIKNGTKVKVYSIKGGWSKVSPDANAWVSSGYLK